MDTEKLATAAVVDSISMTDVLSAFINDGDKEPSWDGNIYIYESAKKNKKGIKKVPVQVKGEEYRQIPPKKKSKYSVKITDLDNWLNDGGVMLFVVFIGDNGKNKLIYYSALVPVLIRKLKEIANGKKSISVPLREFPTDNNKKVGVLLSFYDNMKKQTSFANAPLYTAEELAKEGILGTITFTVTGYGKREEIDVASLFFQNDLYLYANVKGASVPQPLLDIPMDICIGKEVIGNIIVKDKVFYTCYRIARYAEGFMIQIGKSMTLKIMLEKKELILDFKLRGTLSDYILDTECIIAIMESNEITINGATFPFNDMGSVEIEQYKQRLLYYKDVKKMLGLLGVKQELECDNLSEQDQSNIRNFTNALVLGGSIGFPGHEEKMMYGRFKLANLTVLIWADKNNENEKLYQLQNFFGEHNIAIFEENDKNGKRPYRITHYVLLRKKDFLEADNIDYKKIVDDLNQNDTSTIVTEQLVLFMLEMLKAYDEQKNKDDALLKTAAAYCDWLIENADILTEIMVLNKFQIIKRKRNLQETEISKLNELRKTSEDLSVKCGANILLGRMESAQDCFDEMDEWEKERFIDYPISHLGELNYHKTEEKNNG